MRGDEHMTQITMKPEEAAKYLGIKYQTILEYARQKKIPHIRIGRRVFFRQEALDVWMNEQETNSIKIPEKDYGKLRKVQV